VTRTI